MKNVKRIIAVILMAVMALSVTACHKKGEIAVTAKDIEFTSAYYMCALINADNEAKNQINENLSEEEAAESEIDYYSKKIDDKDYKTWVKDKALEYLKDIAAYKLLCEENEIALDDEMKSEAETIADYYWNSYGNSYYYEPNGVSYETYKRYTVDSVYSESYFNHLYGEGGKKEISAEDVKKEIYADYMIADLIEGTFTSDMTDDDKTALKTKLEGYVTALNNGEKTFKEVYNEYNAIEAEESEETHDHSEDEAAHPKDEYAEIIGAEGTNYEFLYFDDVKEMKNGEAKLIELDESAGYLLVVKGDIQSDDYYLDTLDSAARHSLKDEEFEAEITEYQKTFELDVNKYAINQFKVDKIIVPDYSSMY